jgi:hypothetical protein
MKKLILIFLILTSFVSFGQTPGKIIRVPNATTAFGEPVSKSNLIIDSNTGKVYNVLLSLASTLTITTCTLNTDIVELTSNMTISGGMYTPTLTNTTNITTSSLGGATYSRVGNIVHVSIYGNIQPTLAVTSVLKFTLPITTSSSILSGQGIVNFSGGTTYMPGRVDTASTTTATLTFPGTVASGSFTLSFDYVIL